MRTRVGGRTDEVVFCSSSSKTSSEAALHVPWQGVLLISLPSSKTSGNLFTWHEMSVSSFWTIVCTREKLIYIHAFGCHYSCLISL